MVACQKGLNWHGTDYKSNRIRINCFAKYLQKFTLTLVVHKNIRIKTIFVGKTTNFTEAFPMDMIACAATLVTSDQT